MSSYPWYTPIYLSVRDAANSLRVSKPVCRREPLPSIAMMRSCLAMQISSPLQGCVLQARSRRRNFDVSLGHLPFPRVGTITRRTLSWVPPSHAVEQGVHLDHLFSLQSLSQVSVLHSIWSF